MSVTKRKSIVAMTPEDFRERKGEKEEKFE
jgi:hypothetical protein